MAHLFAVCLLSLVAVVERLSVSWGSRWWRCINDFQFPRRIGLTSVPSLRNNDQEINKLHVNDN